jgi:putative ABC transport system permease protein
MIRNYLLLAYRNILKSKFFSLINILGLSLGMASCLLIVQYVMYERSYDNFHTRKERLFRIQQDRYDKGKLSTQWVAGCSAVGQALKENFPEVEEYVRMSNGGGIFSVGDVFFKEDRAYMASEAFFKVFSVRLLKGDTDEVFKRPFTIALSASTAKKYFKDENPIGKSMKLNGRDDFEVTGVFEDFPENTHMKPDILYSFETMVKWAGDEVRTAWQWDGFYNYILLREGIDPKVFESKLPAFIEKEIGEEMKNYDAGVEFHLQPITDIHLDSHYMGEFRANGDRMAVNFLSVIAAFILVIAWINYINLSTAKSVERAKEVGLRKTMGSFRGQLMGQFLLESSLLNIIAFVIALGLVFVVLPYFNELAGRDIGFSLLSQRNFWIVLILVIGTGVVLSGLYPAFVLSGYKPVDVLKGNFSSSWRGLYLRKALVIFQFVATVILLVGTFTVYRQISFMRDQKLGVDIDQTLVIRGPEATDSTYATKFEVFKNALLSHTNIKSVSASTAIPGMQPWWNAGGIRLISQGEEDSKQYRIIGMDYDYVDAFNLEIISGRKFSRDFPNEQGSVLFNESAIKVLGFEDPQEALDKEIFFWGDTFRIVGVLKDYHQESLKKSHEPLIFRFIPDAHTFYSVKLNTDDLRGTIDEVKEKWSATFPGNPLDYFFLDDHYNKQYQADLQFGKISGLFSALAILIACLGLFGLSSLTALQRTKEIGVRKVLGASITSIVVLMGRNFLLLVIIAIVTASPIAWYVMNQWLEEFAYRINMSWWLFVIPGITVILIAMMTIGFHTVRTARVNPAHSLKYE